MREILFRAIDYSYSKHSGYPDNVWRYGDLRQYENGAVGIADKPKECGYSSFSNRIIPKTVGQFTGMLDKNGVKIFEGDIVRRGYDNKNGSFYNNYPIVYSVTEGAFMCGESKRLTKNMIKLYNVEVIGNIHEKGNSMCCDNPKFYSTYYNGICPHCGCDTVDGEALEQCSSSPEICWYCHSSPCDGSCCMRRESSMKKETIELIEQKFKTDINTINREIQINKYELEKLSIKQRNLKLTRTALYEILRTIK